MLTLLLPCLNLTPLRQQPAGARSPLCPVRCGTPRLTLRQPHAPPPCPSPRLCLRGRDTGRALPLLVPGPPCPLLRHLAPSCCVSGSEDRAGSPVTSEGSGQERPLRKRPRDAGIHNTGSAFSTPGTQASPSPSQSHRSEESSLQDGPDGEMVKPQAPESQTRVQILPCQLPAV